jgi:hypothetical protein
MIFGDATLNPFWLTSRYRDTDLVAVAVPYTETALREELKAAGGRWNPEERVWRVCFGAIRGDTTLVERIVSRGTMRADRTGIRRTSHLYRLPAFATGKRDEATYIGDCQVTYIRIPVINELSKNI